MPYYVYVIECENNSFYTGYTMNVRKRMKLHLEGKGARYTRLHRPKKLVHIEKFRTRAQAMRREKRIKTMRHHEKLRWVDLKSQDIEAITCI